MEKGRCGDHHFGFLRVRGVNADCLKREEKLVEVKKFLSALCHTRSLGGPAEILKLWHALFEALLAPALREAGEAAEELLIVHIGVPR